MKVNTQIKNEVTWAPRERPFNLYDIKSSNDLDNCKDCGPGMIGVTIATQDYMPMAVEAARRWKKYSGLECIILTSESGSSWWSKYDLSSVLGKLKVCFFDADVHFVNDIPLDELFNSEYDLNAIHDPGVYDSLAFPYIDCMDFSIDPEVYFNGGLWACDFANPKIIKWLKQARKLTLKSRKPNAPQWKDYGEQTALNISAKDCNLSVNLLPADFGFFHWAWKNNVLNHPNRIIGVHAAGYRGVENKTSILNKLSDAYSTSTESNNTY